MKRLACAISFLLATGPGLVAAEPDEPLANVKQELKQLQTDSAAQKNGTADQKTRSSLPPLILSPAGSTATESLSPLRQSEKDRKKANDTRKNWLIEQYDLLDPKNVSAKPADEFKLADKSLEPKSEHDQLMERLIANDPNGKQTGDASKKHQRLEAPRAPDPFAPFMKDWLANSPASGPMFDSLTKSGANQSPEFIVVGSDYLAGDAPATFRTSIDSPKPDSRRDRSVAGVSAPNPFLPGLEMPFQRESMPSAAPSSPVADPFLPAATAPAPDPLGSPAGGIEAGKRNSLTPPASKLSEDKKYFPQQRRF